MNKNIGFCGIDCSKCELGNKTISKNAETLKKRVENYGISQWYQLVPVADNEKFSFDELNKGLAWLVKYAAYLWNHTCYSFQTSSLLHTF